ncbi:unnamed protein product, partial [Polarella glacialis]
MPTHLTSEELDFVLGLQSTKKLPATEILKKLAAKRLRRNAAASIPDITTVRRALKGKTFRRSSIETRGRKRKMKPDMIKKVNKARMDLVKLAKGEREVHWPEILKKARAKVDPTTAARRLQDAGHDVKWRSPRHELLRDPEHKQERMDICGRWRRKPTTYFTEELDLIMDNKKWDIPTYDRARRFHKMKKVRGHLRTRQEGFKPGFAKPNMKKQRLNVGAYVVVVAGIINSRVKVWHYLDKKQWNGQIAADINKGPIHRALKRCHGEKGRYVVLEDNDPTGYKSNLAKGVKAELGITAMQFPRYSPDLNPCDFFLRDEASIERRMTKNDPGGREAASHYKERLKRTAMAIPEDVISKGVACIKKRAQQQSFLMAALEAGVAQSSGDGGAAEREVEPSIAEVPLDAAADAPGKVWLTAGEVTVDELQAGIRTILAGQDLSTVSMGKLRRRLARTCGFEEDVLDCRADEIKGLAKVVVDEMQACKEEGPAEFMARIISQLGDECASNSMVYLITRSNVLPETLAASELRDVASLSREEVGTCILDALDNPLVSARGGRPRTREAGVKVVKKLAVFEEEHASRLPHYHIAVLLFRLVDLHLRRGPCGSATSWLAIGAAATPNGGARREEAEKEKSAGVPAKRAKFTKLDLTSIILHEDLKSKAAVMEYVQNKGTEAMQTFVSNNQRKLKEFLQDAQEWAAARATAAADRESDWDLLCRTASGPCPHGASCSYAAAARRIFEMNTGSLSKEALALSLRAVILKACAWLEVRFAQLDEDKRFILWDDYRPVEYAQETIHVATFLSMFTGFPFEVQVSQSFNDGNVDFQWNRGAVLTAKEEGLWKPYGEVSGEDIKHLKARVDIFRCTAKVPSLKDTETCASCMCCWIRDAAAAHDARQVLQQPLLPLLGAPHGASLVGFSTIAEAAHLS